MEDTAPKWGIRLAQELPLCGRAAPGRPPGHGKSLAPTASRLETPQGHPRHGHVAAQWNASVLRTHRVDPR
eukprot:5828544-Lingulodinium_polyedra.AAC.1